MISPWTPGAHLFVDESKARDYLMVVAVIVPADMVTARALARSLIYKGQPRLHMKKESDARKKQIASAIVAAGVRAVVYRAAHPVGHELTARAACLEALVNDAAGTSAHRLVLERDDSLEKWDNQQLIELTRKFGCRDTLRYSHQRASQEALLGLPDAIAWCWAKGGHWRTRIEGSIGDVREV